MLDNIKSNYFIKILFSFLDDGFKLKLVKYNKSIKEKIEINIKNYQRYSGKYLIYESKEKVKEYKYLNNNDVLLYEGEYLNGKRHGKGKEFNSNESLLFEGEYLNGKRNGKGKEYNGSFLIFECEYLNGKKWNGRGYDFNKNIIYEIRNGNGLIKEYERNYVLLIDQHDLNGDLPNLKIKYKLKFEGEYINGSIYANAKEYNKDGKLIFEGQYLNGKKWNGKGYDDDGNIIYELKNGSGFIRENDENNGIIFEGEVLYGKKIGKGKEYDSYENIIL